jgi:proteasome lid subunit RPN8/RPN11
MIKQAIREQPNECCGVLAGRAASPEGSRNVLRVERRYPLVNELDSPLEFHSERSLFEAMRDMWKQGLDIVGIYHSHPTSDPVPSRKDRERNCYPDAVHFIISLSQATPRVEAWWLRETHYLPAIWGTVDVSETPAQSASDEPRPSGSGAFTAP